MMEWIAIAISLITLIINFVSQKEKIFLFLEELKVWKAQKNEQKKNLALIKRLGNEGLSSSDTKAKLSFMAFHLPIFLVSVISSIAANYIENQPGFQNTILFSATVYFFISIIVLITFLVTYRRLNWQSAILLFSMTLLVSLMWGILVIIIELFGSKMIWSGIIAGLILTIWLWTSDKNENRHRMKKGL